MLTMPIKPLLIAMMPTYCTFAPTLFWSTLAGAFIATCIGSVVYPVLALAVLLLVLDFLIFMLGVFIFGATLSPV